MRLIDADKINFEEVFGGQSDFAKDLRKAAQELIDIQPTAFDKEKVIDELISEALRWHESGVEFKDENGKGVAAGFRLATRIVEKGGIK